MDLGKLGMEATRDEAEMKEYQRDKNLLRKDEKENPVKV